MLPHKPSKDIGRGSLSSIGAIAVFFCFFAKKDFQIQTKSVLLKRAFCLYVARYKIQLLSWVRIKCKKF